MKEHQHEHEDLTAEKYEIFLRTIKVALKSAPNRITAIPTSVMEAMLVSISNNLDILEQESTEQLKARYVSLRANQHFTGESVAEGLSKKDKTAARFKAAAQIFG